MRIFIYVKLKEECWYRVQRAQLSWRLEDYSLATYSKRLLINNRLNETGCNSTLPLSDNVIVYAFPLRFLGVENRDYLLSLKEFGNGLKIASVEYVISHHIFFD
jgi:hypothetical protein